MNRRSKDPQPPSTASTSGSDAKASSASYAIASEPASATGKDWREIVRWLWRPRLVLVILLGVLTVTVAWAYSAMKSTPDYWAQRNAMLATLSASERRILAERARDRIMEPWSVPSQYASADDYRKSLTQGNLPPKLEGDTRTVSVSLEDVNLFLADGFAELLGNHGIKVPKEVRGVMVAQERGRPVLAMHVQTKDFDQVVSMVIDVGFDEEEQATLEVVSARAGRLPLPTETVRQQLVNRPEIRKDPRFMDLANRIFRGEVLGIITARLDNDRNARIIGMTIDDEAVHITRRVETREGGS